MTDQWLNDLERYLQYMPFEDRFDLVMNYKEQIQIMKENGLSDEAIVGKFGSAKQVAKELSDSFGDNLEFEQANTKKEAYSETFKSHVSGATEQLKSMENPLIKALYWFLFGIFLLAAFSFILTGIGLSFAAVVILIFTFPFINLSLGVFFICFATSLLVFNVGLAMTYYPYKLSKHLYRKLV